MKAQEARVASLELVGYMKVFCPSCREHFSQCTTLKAYRKCQKWCEDCCGTTRIPIPNEEVLKIRGEQ